MNGPRACSSISQAVLISLANQVMRFSGYDLNLDVITQAQGETFLSASFYTIPVVDATAREHQPHPTAVWLTGKRTRPGLQSTAQLQPG